MYQNIHTQQVCELERIETVSNPPIRVYCLSDGMRWNETLFFEHWRNLTTLAVDTPQAQEISGQ